MAKPPSSLPPTTSSPLKVSLLLGSFEHDPARYELLDLVLPASQPAPQHADEATFSLLPEIAHTFRPDQKLPPKAISAAFSALVTAPWLALFFLVRLNSLCSQCLRYLAQPQSMVYLRIPPIVVQVRHQSSPPLRPAGPTIHQPPRGVRRVAPLVLGRPPAGRRPPVRDHPDALHRLRGQNCAGRRVGVETRQEVMLRLYAVLAFQ